MSVSDLIDRFSELHVLVVGDVMIDSYLWGRVDRMSPEAPVPVVSIERRNARLGGAANVAKNIRSLGAKASIVAVVGNDRGKEQVIELCEEQGISTDGLLIAEERKTTVKTRVISNDKHVVRVDDEQVDDLDGVLAEKLIEYVSTRLDRIDLIILEDYNKGVLSEKVISSILELARNSEVPVAVDPKKKNFMAYQGVQLFKPNFKELCEGTGMELSEGDKEGVRSAVKELKSKLGNFMTMVTLSEHGVYIEDGAEEHFLPAHPRNIVDVSGAGDSVIATAGLCLAAGCDPYTIAVMSNLAGGIVCEQVGVVPINKADLKHESLQLSWPR